MSNRILKEQLKNMFTLVYGKELAEQVVTQVTNDTKKADTVKDDVEELYKNLENAISGGGISQEERGTMSFKKEVESMQIGLILLGYELPNYGVDGYFGPETAEAVKKYEKNNNIINESSSHLRQVISDLGYVEKGSEITSGGEITNVISRVVENILRAFKKLRPDVKVRITGGNDAHHQKNSKTSKHREGNAIDLTLDPKDNKTLDDFISVIKGEMSKDNKISFIDEYRHPSSGATAGHMHISYGGSQRAVSNSSTTTTVMTKASPKMLSTLLTQLKNKGIKDEDIKKYTNINTSTMSAKGKELVNNPDFMAKIKDIGEAINVPAEAIINIMNHESKLDPQAKNSFGCVGLNQFCPDTRGGSVKTIGNIKYNLEELRTDLTLQLKAIKEFWLEGYRRGKIKQPVDLLLYNFYPVSAGKDDSFVLQTKGQSAESVANANPLFNSTLGRPRATPLSVGDIKRFAEIKGYF